MSQWFSKAEGCILCALSQLDGFPLKPLTQGHSRSLPERSWKHMQKTKERKTTTPRMILIPKGGSLRTSVHKTLTQTSSTTTLPPKLIEKVTITFFENTLGKIREGRKCHKASLWDCSLTGKTTNVQNLNELACLLREVL